jgi:hypothetical protein
MTFDEMAARAQYEWERAEAAEAEAKQYADRIEELEAKLAKVKVILEREIRRVQEIQSAFPPPHKVGLVYVEEEYRRMLVEMMGETDD